MKTQWHNLKSLAVNKFMDVPNTPGIYFVRWSKNGKPIFIGRLAGVDHEGLLYVGSAMKLRRRVRQLWRGINGQVRHHTIGKTIIFCKVFEIVDLNEYEISWEELMTREEAVGQEWTAMKLYANKYKEPPPLNLGVRREFFAVWDIAKWGKSRWAYEPDRFVTSIIDS